LSLKVKAFGKAVANFIFWRWWKFSTSSVFSCFISSNIYPSGNLLGFNIEDFIPIVVQYGKFAGINQNTKRIYQNSTFKFIVQTKYKGKDKAQKRTLNINNSLPMPYKNTRPYRICTVLCFYL